MLSGKEIKMTYRERMLNHIKLALCIFKQNPFILIFVLPTLVVTVIVWINMEYILNIFDAPKIILPIYIVTVKFICVLIPLLFFFASINFIGFVFAYEDEKNIKNAFAKGKFKDECPILMYKKKDKQNNTITRKWISHIALKGWNENIDNIEHEMTEHLVKELSYDSTAKDNRIVMCSASGMGYVEVPKKLYDLKLEKDMEMFR